MAFVYKTQDRTDALDRDMGDRSFYAIAAETAAFARIEKHFTDYQQSYAKHTIRDGTTQFISMLALFHNLLGDSAKVLNDELPARRRRGQRSAARP